MFQDLSDSPHRPHPPADDDACEPADPHADRETRRGFWGGLADVLLSMPAGIGIRIGG